VNGPSDPKAVRAAIKNFRRLLELEPRHRGHREQLARLYEADLQPKAALREWLGLARELRQDGFLEDAVAAAREALRVEPGYEEAMGFLASAFAGAPRSVFVPTVTAAMPVDPLDELGRPERDAPLDAVALVKVYSADEAGAELASQSSIDLSLSVDGSFGASVDLVADGGRGDAEDHRATIDLLPDSIAAAPTTVELTEDDLQPAPAPEPVRPTVGSVAVPIPRIPRATLADDPAGTVDIDVELFTAAEAQESDERPPEPPARSPFRAPPPSMPLFSALPRASMQELMHRADRRLFLAGTDVMRAGEAVDGLYVVMGGAVRLTVRSFDGHGDVEICLLEAGGFFGAVELLDPQPARVTATAVEDAELMKIGAEKVGFLRRHFPAFERSLDEAAELQTVGRYLASSRLFGHLPARDRIALAARFRPIALGPGEELFAEGSSPEGLYLVTRGKLIVYRDGHTLTQLPAGDFVGVVSMLRQEVARCTALAGPSAQVVCLDPEEVELVLTTWQSVRESFWREARERASLP
jgi:CRP-like cAMP-binding protein